MGAKTCCICALEFTGKGLACEPGDLIVRD